MKKRVKGNDRGNNNNGVKNQGSGSQTTEKNNKKKITITALKTFIRSFEKLFTDQSNTMVNLKTQ